VQSLRQALRSLGRAASLSVAGKGHGILLTIVARQGLASLIIGVPRVDAAAIVFTSPALCLVVLVAAVGPAAAPRVPDQSTVALRAPWRHSPNGGSR
jgi:hypothetical protein